MNMKETTFNYESLMEVIDFAEFLGWEDTYTDCTDDDYDEYVADAIEEECIRFIAARGYTVECIA